MGLNSWTRAIPIIGEKLKSTDERKLKTLEDMTNRALEGKSVLGMTEVYDYREALIPIMSDDYLRNDPRVIDSLMKVVQRKGRESTLGRFAFGTVANHMDLLESVIKGQDEPKKKLAEDLLVDLFAFGVGKDFRSDTRNRAAEMVTNLTDDFERAEMEKRKPAMILYYTMMAPYQGNNDRLIELMGSPETCKRVVETCFGKEEYCSLNENTAYGFGVTWLSVLGVENMVAEDMVRSWMKLDKYDEAEWSQMIKDTYIRNLSTISKLNINNSEAVMLLYKEFGITHFGRYSVELLTEQFNNQNNSDIEFGVWLGAYADHNSALNNDYSVKEVDKLWNQSKKLGMGLRIIESRSRHDTIGKFIDMYRRYNGQQKVKFMVVAGHGSPTTITLGSDDGVIRQNRVGRKIDPGQFSVDDFRRNLPKSVREIFEEDFPTVFVSCLADAGDMVRQFSSQWKNIASGAKESITAEGEIIELRRINNKLVFDVHFNNANTGTVDGGLYKAGSDYKADLQKEKDVEFDLEFREALTNPERMESIWRDRQLRPFFLEKAMGGVAMKEILNHTGGSEIYLSVQTICGDGKRGIRWLDVKDVQSRRGFLLDSVRLGKFFGRSLEGHLPLVLLEDLDRLEKKAYEDGESGGFYNDVVILVGRKNEGGTVGLLGAVSMDARFMWPSTIRAALKSK